MNASITLCESCNMTCDYCSLSQSAAKQRKIDSQFILEQLNKYNVDGMVSFTGGEPLLEFETIKQVVNNYPARYKIITNGILFKQIEILNFIKDNGINVVVSYDGLQNSSRQIDNSLILNNIILLSYFVKPTVSMSVTNQNVDSIIDDIKVLKNIVNANVFVKPIIDNKDFIPDITKYKSLVANIRKRELANVFSISNNESLSIHFSGSAEVVNDYESYVRRMNRNNMDVDLIKLYSL